jgi:hypothetical protein
VSVLMRGDRGEHDIFVSNVLALHSLNMVELIFYYIPFYLALLMFLTHSIWSTRFLAFHEFLLVILNE